MKRDAVKTLTALLALIPGTVAAQAPDLWWTRTYGLEDVDRCYDIALASDGFVAAGVTASFLPFNGYQGYLVRIDAAGDTVWTGTYNKPSNTQTLLNAVLVTPDERIVGVGGTYEGNFNIYLVETDAAGEVLWQRSYDIGTGALNHTDVGNDVVSRPGGGYTIAGTTLSIGAGHFDALLLAVAADGDSLWRRRFGGSEEDRGKALVQTSDGGYVLAGLTRSFGAGGSDVYVVRTDSTGAETWSRTFGGPGDDAGFAVCETSSGGFVVAGKADASGAGDVYALWLDAAGDSLFTRRYGTSGDSIDIATSVEETSDGGFLFAGYESRPPGTDNYVMLIKTDATGAVEWKWAEPTCGTGDLGLHHPVGHETTDLGYVVSGMTSLCGAGGEDMFVARLAPEFATTTAAYWRFEEGAPGDTLTLDVSGNGNHGRLHGDVAYVDTIPTVVIPLTGESNAWSLRFDGLEDGMIDDAVSAPDSPSLRPTAGLTLEAYIRAEPDAWVVLGKQVGGGFANSYQLELTSGILGFNLSDENHAEHKLQTPFSSWNEWKHVAATWDGSTMRIYVDGCEAASAAYAGNIGYDGNPVIIGADDDGGGVPGNAPFHGLIDEVRISRVALDPSEFLHDGCRPVGVDLAQAPSARWWLSRPRPNPFESEVRVTMTLVHPSPVTVDVFDAAGRRITRLIDGIRPSGSQIIRWDGLDARLRPVAAGVYWIQAKSPEGRQTRKILLTR